MQLNTTGVERQVSRNRDGGVVEGKRVRVSVVVSSQIVATAAHGLTSVERIGDQLVAIQGWVVKHHRCRLQEEVKVRAPGVATAGVPAAGQRCVRVVIGVGLVLTCRTEGSDDVVFVGRTVAVFHNHPNAGVSIGVSHVAADLEQFV